MASIIQRITTWATNSLLKSADINGEFNNVVNVLNNLDSATTTWDNVKTTTLTLTAQANSLAMNNQAVTGVASVQSNTANPAAAGLLRLADADTINWRNHANNGDVSLSKNTSDQLLWAGGEIADASGHLNLANVTGTLAIGNGGTNSATSLNNNRVMVSSIGAIVENPNGKISNGAIMVADPNGNPTGSTGGTLSGNLGFDNTSTHGIGGTTTNDSAAAGNVGEYVSSTASAVSAPTTNTFGDMTSISLTAGDWDVSLNVMFNTNSATLSGIIIAGIGTGSGTSNSGLTDGNSDVYLAPNSTQTIASGAVPGFRVSIASTTTYYAKMKANYSAGTPQFTCRMSARRVR